MGRHLRCTNQVAELTAVRVAVEIAVDEGSVTQEGSSPNAKNIIFFFQLTTYRYSRFESIYGFSLCRGMYERLAPSMAIERVD